MVQCDFCTQVQCFTIAVIASFGEIKLKKKDFEEKIIAMKRSSQFLKGLYWSTITCFKLKCF